MTYLNTRNYAALLVGRYDRNGNGMVDRGDIAAWQAQAKRTGSHEAAAMARLGVRLFAYANTSSASNYVTKGEIDNWVASYYGRSLSERQAKTLTLSLLR